MDRLTAPALWALDLGPGPCGQDAWRPFLPLVSPLRRCRARRLRDPLKACQTVAAELLLRWALAPLLGADAFRLRLREDGFGKPELAERPDIRFNLTHAGRYVCLALGHEPVGVDVEEIRPVDVDAFASWLAGAEREWIARAPGRDARLERLFIVWTRKESVAKAIGRGHGVPFASFSVVSEASSGVLLRPVVLGWHVEGGRLPGGHVLGVARARPGPWPDPAVVPALALLADLAPWAARLAGGGGTAG